MQNANNPIDLLFICTGIAGTAVSSTIGDVLGIILTIVNIVYLVALLGFRIYAKIKRATEDGVIDADEAEDIANTIKDGIEEVKKHEDK